MNKIESVVAGMKYEPVPSFPYQYTNEVITAAEQLAGKKFPEDFKWYLLNVGWRKLAYDYRSILVPTGGYIYTLQFEGAEHQTFSLNRYKQYLENNNGAELPFENRFYYPFGKIEGEINPAVSFQLLVNLNKEYYGTIWAIKSFNYNDKLPAPSPMYLADNLASFLQQINADARLRPVAAETNKALFLDMLEEQLAKPDVFTTRAASAEQLLRLFLANDQPFNVNAIRNVEFQHLDNALRVENRQKLQERIDAFSDITHSYRLARPLKRSKTTVSAPVLLERSRFFNWGNDNYYLVDVESMVGDNNVLKESFLLYQDIEKSQWSMIRRYQASIDDVKIKEIGTFSFDVTGKWMLKKMVTPAWSQLPAVFRIEGEEDALTGPLITFAKEILDKADFKPVLEAFIFRILMLKAFISKDFGRSLFD